MDGPSLCKALKQGLQEDLAVTPQEICGIVFINLRAGPFSSQLPGEMHPPPRSQHWEGLSGTNKGSQKLDSAESYPNAATGARGDDIRTGVWIPDKWCKKPNVHICNASIRKVGWGQSWA